MTQNFIKCDHCGASWPTRSLWGEDISDVAWREHDHHAIEQHLPPKISITRGGIRWPLAAVATSTPDALGGWCAPSSTIYDLHSTNVEFNEEETNVTTEDELLNVIAAAESRLTGLRMLPETEPGEGSKAELMFRVTTRDRGEWTWLVIRAESGYWYRTGSEGRTGGPIGWNEMRDFFSKRTVTSWQELAPFDPATVLAANEEFNAYVDCIEDAKQLLAAAGYTGTTLTSQINAAISKIQWYAERMLELTNETETSARKQRNDVNRA